MNKWIEPTDPDEINEIFRDPMRRTQYFVEKTKKELAEIDAKRRQQPALKAPQQMLTKQLLRARLRKKLSQKELAGRIGTQQSTIARIEGGKGNPSLHTLLKIAQALGVNIVVE